MSSSTSVIDFWRLGVTPSTATFTLNETTDQIEYDFQCPDDIVISEIFVNLGTQTGSPTLEASIQGLDSSSRADGTIKNSGNAKVSWTGVSGAIWKTLNATYSATRGERLCLVLKMTAGTSSVVTLRITGINTTYMTRVGTYDNATTTFSYPGTSPLFGISDGVSKIFGQPVSSTSNLTNSSANNRFATMFTVPDDSGIYDLIGIGGYLRGGSGTSFTFELYTGGLVSDTTIVDSFSNVVGTDLNTSNGFTEVFFSKTRRFYPGDKFRIAINNNSSGTIGCGSFDVLREIDFAAFGNPNFYSSTRTTGNWTDNTLRRHAMWPIFQNRQTLYIPVGGR